MPFISSRRDCARRCDEYKCSYCPTKTFHNSCSLVKHLKKSLAHKSKHHDQAFECTICNNAFASRTGYIHHLQQKRIHKYDLHQASCCGKYQDVSKLINSENANVAGASHKVKSDTELNYQLGATPMHCAAFKGYSRCLRIMLAWQDGDANVVDEYGQTPVHVAARCGRATSLMLLLRKGGRLDIRDKEYKTPIYLATENCMHVIMEYKIECVILKYRKPKVTVTRSLEEGERGGEEHVSEGEEHTTSKDFNTVKRSLSFPQGDDSKLQGDLCESELCVTTEDNKTDTVSLCPRASLEETNCNEQQVIGRNASMLEDESLSCLTDTVSLCSRASLEETNCNEQQVIGRNASMLEDGSSTSISEVSSELVPYEIIARGKNAVAAFKTALSQGTAPASRLKLIVVGEVGAGKTSLTRSLSRQPFMETRKKTHGIQTSTISESLVENTELDVSWKLADPEDSHLDEIIAKIVSESLTENNVASRNSNLPALSLRESNENQIDYGVCTPSKRPVSPAHEARVLVQSSIAVEGTPRKLPATLIAKHLWQKKKEELSFKVSIWDFAGHQLYETMHHMFMNSRSLYLVVFSLVKMSKSQDKCLARIHYWLNSIASHTSRSTPIILVGTHQAKVHSDVVEETDRLIEKHFGHAFGPRLIRNCGEKILFAVENKDGQNDEGVSSLIKVIKSEASSCLPFVTEEFPLKWLHCEEEIVAYQQVAGNKKFMTFDEVRDLLGRTCNVNFTEDEFRSMLAFFHDSGVILLPDTMCEGESSECLKDIVVLSPQYLVDVMTRLHDIRGDRRLKRRFSDEFKKLKDEGRADCHLLDHLWKDLEKNELLVELLTHFNLLYPLHNEIEDEQLKQDSAAALDANSSSVENSSRREFIIPCMLKEKSSESIERHWNAICEKWKDLSTREHVLAFDFGRFLPPALFDYLVVHIYRHSHKTKGMQPILKRRNGIFSFSNKFLFRMELLLKDSQILVYARCKPGEHFLNFACKLRENVNQICQKYFKFLKFISGPPCPRPDCRGAMFNAEVVQRPSDSSSSESADSSDDNEGCVEEKEVKRLASCTEDDVYRRRHVIPMIPYSFDPPYWCQQVPIDEHALEDWNTTNITAENLCESFDDTETTDGLAERCTEECCVSCTARYLGKDWKEVARNLDAEESELENIDTDYAEQKEQGFQALLSWKKRKGNDAGVGILLEALQKAGRKDVSDKLEKHYQEEHN